MDAPVEGERRFFGCFRLDPRGGRLFRRDLTGDWEPVAIGSRALDILRVLLRSDGAVVSKDTIMDAVWPGVAVEPNNLSVQITALRRVLDAGGSGESCIQAVPGRGYRFLPEIRYPADRSEPPPAVSVTAERGQGWLNKWYLSAAAAFAVVLVAVIGLASGFFGREAAAPRLSIVVLPFENLSGDPKDDYLAGGITDDLTSDLSNIPDAFVIARESAYTYRGKPADVRKIGEELGVRYVLEGSVRRIASTLRVNVQLTSAETGAHLWSDRFDEQISELAAGQEQIVTRMRSELGISLVEIEKTRSLRERPSNPDAFDLIPQARALANQPPSLQRNAEVKTLYERALERDPSSAAAMVGIANYLVDRRASTGSWGTLESKQRAESLLIQARALSPDSPILLGVTAYWLRILGRCREAMATAEEAIRRFPNSVGGYAQLGQCKPLTGHAEEEIPLIQKAIRVSPRHPYLFNFYRKMGDASLLLGRDHDAITFFERSLAVSPDNDGNRSGIYLGLAAAYARSGLMPEAKRALAEAHRLNPYYTVRAFVPYDTSNPVYAEQIKRLQDALRLAGERDHADEDADFGVAADGVLRNQLAGLTPTTTPGVSTIRTKELAALLAEVRPLVIDASYYMWGRSIPGAVGLEDVGLGGSFADAAQDHLRRKMHELSGGDLNRPIVAVGWNSESFRGRNLALRLVALGYTQVLWYRGGREAWEVGGLPESPIDIQDW
jgi:adenylate cyclase